MKHLVAIIFITIGCIAISGIASGGEVNVNIDVSVKWYGFNYEN